MSERWGGVGWTTLGVWRLKGKDHEAAETQTQLKQFSKPEVTVHAVRVAPFLLSSFAGSADESMSETPTLEAQRVKATELEVGWEFSSGLCGCTRSLARIHVPQCHRLAAGLARNQDGGTRGQARTPT